MVSTKLYVNDIIDHESKGTYGVESDFVRISKDLSTMFRLQKDIEDLTNMAKQQPDGLSYMHRFCQFIVYINLSNKLVTGSNLAFFDCRDDMDTALDVHLHFTKTGFGKMVKEDFMNQFLEIREIYDQVKDMAQLTTEELE